LLKPENSLNLQERTISGLHEFLTKHLPVIEKSAKILDVGCGTGAWLNRLKSSGYSDLQGADLDTDQFKLAGIEARKVNLVWEKLPYSDQTFDLITCIEVIEHIENTGFFLNELKRVLKPDGRILLTTPNTQSLIARLRLLITGKLKSFDEKGDPTHISPIFMYPFQKILARHALKIEHTFYFPKNRLTLTSRPITQITGKLLRLLLPDPTPGDTIDCLIQMEETC